MVETEQDLLRFTGGVVSRYEVMWTGPWPPPEKMVVLVGTESGMVRITELGLLGVNGTPSLDEILDVGSINVCVYALGNHSALPDRVPGVLRCAEYLPEKEAE